MPLESNCKTPENNDPLFSLVERAKESDVLRLNRKSQRGRAWSLGASAPDQTETQASIPHRSSGMTQRDLSPVKKLAIGRGRGRNWSDEKKVRHFGAWGPGRQPPAPQQAVKPLNDFELRVIKQVRYYFSNTNLPADEFLRNEIRKSDHQCKS